MPLQFRAYAGVAIALCLTVYATIVYFKTAARAQPGQHDLYGVSAGVERFAPARAAVNPGTFLGYLTDIPPEFPERVTAWNVARYAMAPAMLQPSAEAAPLVLGDLKRPEEAEQFLAQHGFTVDRDFGCGVMLLRRSR